MSDTDLLLAGVSALDASRWLLEALGAAIETPDEIEMTTNISREVELHRAELSTVISSFDAANAARSLLEDDTRNVLDLALAAAGRVGSCLDAIAAGASAEEAVVLMRTFPADFRAVARSRHILFEAMRTQMEG